MDIQALYLCSDSSLVLYICAIIEGDIMLIPFYAVDSRNAPSSLARPVSPRVLFNPAQSGNTSPTQDSPIIVYLPGSERIIYIKIAILLSTLVDISQP